MSQVVDLGYVVGPTGPKGDDATLPSTTKVTVYVGAPVTATSGVYEYHITYVSDRQVNEVTIYGNVNPDTLSLDDFTQLEVDYGSIVSIRAYRIVSTSEIHEQEARTYFFDTLQQPMEEITGNHYTTPCVYQYKGSAFVCVFPVAAFIEILM